jgi:large subunit ribosomal protein L10
MSKPIKDLISRELQTRYNDLDNVLWIELTGADGTTTNAFRRELRSKDMHIEIVRNSLFRRAVASGRLAALAPLADALSGPAALVTGGESLVDVAKLVEEWRPKIRGLKFRGAVLEGEYMDEQGVAGLSKMPTKRELQGRIAAAALAPGANLSAALLAGGGNIAGCLKALIEKLEKAETSAAA